MMITTTKIQLLTVYHGFLYAVKYCIQRSDFFWQVVFVGEEGVDAGGVRKVTLCNIQVNGSSRKGRNA